SNLADSVTAPAAPPITPASPTATPLPTATPSDTSITPVAASPPPTAPAAGTSSSALYAGMTVTPSYDVTVYSGPDDEAMAIDVVTPRMPLTVVRARGPWVDVSYAGGTRYGWVHHYVLTPSGTVGSTYNGEGQSGPESGTATPTSGPGAAPTGR